MAARPARSLIRIDPGSEFRRVAAVLREIDRDLPADLREELHDAVEPVIRRVKRNALGIPVHGRKHTGLRGRVAAGVQSHVFVGRKPGVEVTVKMRDPDERNLPAYLDNPADGWRHPLFGNRHKWVPQHTGDDWFRDELASSDDEIEWRLQHVMDRAAETIAAAGRG